MPFVEPQSSPSRDGDSVPSVLQLVIEQNDCLDCGGPLSHDTYKGRDAAVCTDCGTPRAQLADT